MDLFYHKCLQSASFRCSPFLGFVTSIALAPQRYAEGRVVLGQGDLAAVASQLPPRVQAVTQVPGPSTAALLSEQVMDVEDGPGPVESYTLRKLSVCWFSAWSLNRFPEVMVMTNSSRSVCW